MAFVEDRRLPEQPVGLLLLPPRDRLLEHLEHPLPGRGGRVERAALDERLEHALVRDLPVDALGEVPDRRERAALVARAHDRGRGALADALDRVQAEADLALDDGEVDLRRVHVRRQHLDPHLVAGVDVEGHLVLRVHHRRDQRGHVLARVVRAQPGGLVGDQRVAGGVRLVERVVLRAARCRPRAGARPARTCRFAMQPSMNLSFRDAISAWIFLPIALRRSSASAGVKPAICLAISMPVPGRSRCRTRSR